MDAQRNTNKWLPWLKARPPAQLRLFCFAHAGGGPSLFSRWARLVPKRFELLPVQLPGHEGRFRERPFHDIDSLLAAVIEGLHPLFEDRFALFGHSVGALIAFELARRLRQQGGREPECLIVSSLRAPHLHARMNRAAGPMHQLPDDELLRTVDRRFGGIPAEIAANKEYLAILCPVLRADLAIAETYTFEPQSPLDCPILALGGSGDREVPLHDLMAWEAHTRGGFSWRLFAGGHFYLREASAEVVGAITTALDEARDR